MFLYPDCLCMFCCSILQVYTKYFRCFMYNLGEENLRLAFLMGVGKYSCIVMMSIFTFAVFKGLRLRTGKPNAFLKLSSIAMIIFSLGTLGGGSGKRSHCMRSSG